MHNNLNNSIIHEDKIILIAIVNKINFIKFETNNFNTKKLLLLAT